MPLAILLLIVEIALVVHAVRTGKDTYWIYLIIFVPVVGSAVYFITQVLPDLTHMLNFKILIKINNDINSFMQKKISESTVFNE